jgi:sulfur carrier protein ThiS
MFHIQVKLFGTVRRLSQPGTPGLWVGDVPEGSTILDLLALLGTSRAEVAGATINDEFARFDAKIPEGAVIVLVTPVGGGAA